MGSDSTRRSFWTCSNDSACPADESMAVFLFHNSHTSAKTRANCSSTILSFRHTMVEIMKTVKNLSLRDRLSLQILKFKIDLSS